MREFDLADILHATYTAKERVTEAAKMVNDVFREKRFDVQECQACFYLSRIGGCAMTPKNCNACGIEVMYSSTNTDKLCRRCALARGVCKHCGADMDLKPRRAVPKSN